MALRYRAVHDVGPSVYCVSLPFYQTKEYQDAKNSREGMAQDY